MGTINPANRILFTTTDALFSRIRKRLSSFDAAGLLDEGDFYYYIKEIIERLGVSVYDEVPVILPIVNFKARLPDDFSYLYAAYKICSSGSTSHSTQPIFQGGVVIYSQETRQPYKMCTNCHASQIHFVEGEKIVAKTFLEGTPHIFSYNTPTLLNVASNLHSMCYPNSPNLHSRSIHQISIDKHYIHTNFNYDSIFMKYYAMPLDAESGLPMIPNETWIEKAMEDYIVYRIIEDVWFNGSLPDMENKYKVAKMNSDDSMKAALYYVKLPSFQTAINYIRQVRKNHRIYQQTNF